MKPKTENTILFSGGEVPKKFYDSLLEQVIANSNKTIVGVVYDAEKILGTNYWVKQLFKEERTMAGRCIKDMEKRDLIPYEFVERLPNNTSVYKRIGN